MSEFFRYLPVDDTTMRWGLYLTGAGVANVSAGADYPPGGHPNVYNFRWETGRTLPEFQMILITDGKGIFESKQIGEVEISENTLLMLFPDVWHRYKPEKVTGWKERWVSFNGEIAHSLLDQGYFTPTKAVSYLTEPAKLIAEFDLFLSQIKMKPAENNLLTSLRTMALINKVIESVGYDDPGINQPYHENPMIHEDPLINSVLDLIWTHSHRPISINYILKHVPVSRRTLERRFQKTCGHSIHEEIIRCRLSRAKRLLRETHLPIKTIAYLSGFNHPERMRTAFEKHEKKPPSKFRD